MADEKKIAEENLSDEGEASTDELNKVAGGNMNTDTDSNLLGVKKHVIWL